MPLECRPSHMAHNPDTVARYKAELELLEKYTLPQERKALEANVESAKGSLELTRQQCTNRDKQAKTNLTISHQCAPSNLDQNARCRQRH